MNNTTSAQTARALDGLSLEEYTAQARFRRTITFKSATTGKDVAASYAIAGNQDPTAPTFLYVGGIFGGRLHSLWIDYLAKKENIRGIFVDRPGVGLFTAVTIEQRVQVWLEAVPHILADVGVQQIVVVALSGGVPYTLALLWHHPELFQPNAPIFLLSPWVHPSKSGVRMHSFMGHMPASFTRVIGRMTALTLYNLLISRLGTNAKARHLLANEDNIPETCGGSPEEIQRHRHFFGTKIFTESTSGSIEDYLLGIKDTSKTWDVCADYEDYARRLSERCEAGNSRLRFQVWFAAHDIFIGEKGIRYFDDTFSSSTAQRGFDYNSEVIEGTNHEQIVLPENGVVKKMMEMVSAAGLLDRPASTGT